ARRMLDHMIVFLERDSVGSGDREHDVIRAFLSTLTTYFKGSRLSDRVDIRPFVEAVLKHHKWVSRDVAAMMAAKPFDWRPLEESTFDALFKVIMYGTDGRYDPHP